MIEMMLLRSGSGLPLYEDFESYSAISPPQYLMGGLCYLTREYVTYPNTHNIRRRFLDGDAALWVQADDRGYSTSYVGITARITIPSGISKIHLNVAGYTKNGSFTSMDLYTSDGLHSSISYSNDFTIITIENAETLSYVELRARASYNANCSIYIKSIELEEA